jgi:HD-GYP domain-containing protein (c-di-GMP phosphodiesterase class II)
MESARRTLEAGGVRNVDYTLLRKDGASFPAELNAALIKDTEGKPKAFIGVVRDVTERKRTEEALREACDELELSVRKRTAELVRANEALRAEIAERKKAEERIERQLHLLSALRAIDIAITASFDLRLTMGVILEQTTSQLGVDAADVLLLDPHIQMLEYTAGRGFRTNAPQHIRLRLGEGCAGRAALEHRIVGIQDLAEDTCDLTHASLCRDEQFIAYYAAPLIAKGQVKGVLEVFHRAPLDPDREWLDFLEALAGQAAIAIDNSELFYNLQRSNLDLALAYDTTLEGWSRAMDLRDRETEGHSQRVAGMTACLARMMGLKDGEIVHIRRGALLHDIGKMGIPDSILHKTGPLTEEEQEIMCRHPVYAYEMLSPIAYLRPALDIPYCHHEKWDGTGYPRGLKGEVIPLPARIFAVVDVWDALHSDRPYRSSWSAERSREHIQELSGTHFDPQVVDVFLEMEQ